MVAGAGACTGDDHATDASDDRYGIRPTPDSGGDDAATDGGPAATATMRLAHLSPDLPPIDFCWRTSGAATYNGPVLGGRSDAGAQDAAAGDAWPDAADATLDSQGGDADATVEDGAAADAGGYDADAAPSDASDAQTGADAGPLDGGVTELSFGRLTGDIAFPTSGTFDIALVPAGVVSCDHPIIVQHVTLDAGKHSTVVAMGLASVDAGADAALSLVTFVDDARKDAQLARVRIVHAALGAAGGSPGPQRIEVLVGSTVVAPSVQPKQASAESTMPSIDVLGYASVPPVTDPAAIKVVATTDAGAQGSWTTPAVSLDVQASTVHTGFVVNLRQGPLGVLWCTETNTGGPLAGCAMLPASD